MKSFAGLIIFGFAVALGACKSSVKERGDEVYSRHLQRHIPLTIITTPMPSDKEKMNLLLFNGDTELKSIGAKKIIDSLYKKKLIQPLVLVAWEGKKGDYGLEETQTADGKQHKKFNEFVSGELYPFIKKKVVIRKFNAVAICGFNEGALSAFDIAWNNDEKIQMAGIFYPAFAESKMMNDSMVIATIKDSRKRPALKLWLTISEGSVAEEMFRTVIKNKSSISEFKIVDNRESEKQVTMPVNNFAAFLLWAFPAE
jgi:enterochelin esterase-like enzyme